MPSVCILPSHLFSWYTIEEDFAGLSYEFVVTKVLRTHDIWTTQSTNSIMPGYQNAAIGFAIYMCKVRLNWPKQQPNKIIMIAALFIYTRDHEHLTASHRAYCRSPTRENPVVSRRLGPSMKTALKHLPTPSWHLPACRSTPIVNTTQHLPF